MHCDHKPPQTALACTLEACDTVPLSGRNLRYARNAGFSRLVGISPTSSRLASRPRREHPRFMERENSRNEPLNRADWKVRPTRRLESLRYTNNYQPSTNGQPHGEFGKHTHSAAHLDATAVGL